jgi:hypothetical protein
MSSAKHRDLPHIAKVLPPLAWCHPCEGLLRQGAAGQDRGKLTRARGDPGIDILPRTLKLKAQAKATQHDRQGCKKTTSFLTNYFLTTN